MKRRFAAFLVLFLIPFAARAAGPLASDGGGIQLQPWATTDEVAAAWGASGVCTDGPGYTMVVAQGFGLVAQGPGLVPHHPIAWPIVTEAQTLAANPTLSASALTAIASSEDATRIYLGFAEHSGYQAGAPILAVDYDGKFETIATAAELKAVVPQGTQVRALAVGRDGTVYATVGGTTTVIVRVDPGKPEGQRVAVVMDQAGVEAGLPNVGPQPANRFGEPLTVDDKGRLFFRAFVQHYGDSQVEERRVIVRLDPDGKMAELTTREQPFLTADDPTGQQYKAHPANCISQGLRWDADSGLLVGVGSGLFLIHPDLPGVSVALAPAGAIASVLYEYGGEDGIHGGSPAGCIARLSWNGATAWASQMDGFYLFSYDADAYDLDGDLLDGREERALGTDPAKADSDGGGASDGVEVLLDWTDPKAKGDDRSRATPTLARSLYPVWWGSEGASSVEEPLIRFGAVDPAGGIRIGMDVAKDGWGHAHRWTGPDTPAADLSQADFLSYADPRTSVLASDGTAFGVDVWGTKALMRFPEGGGATEVIDGATHAALVGADPVPTFLDPGPSGDLWIGYRNGKVVRIAADGKAALFYDAWKDFVESGGGGEDGRTCFGGMQCNLIAGPFAYEPVRGLMYFWLTLEVLGSYSAYEPWLMAVLPDGTIRIVADQAALRESMTYFGGQSISGMAPDGAGGLWVLGVSGLERSLVHLDAGMQAQGVPTLLQPGISNANGSPFNASRQLAHANQLLALPGGRLFTFIGSYFNQYPTTWGLAEIVPMDGKVRGGDYVVVHPEQGFLAKVGAGGGGTTLLEGAALGRPVAVAATEDLVAVADAANGKVLFIDVKDGVPGAPVAVPAGVATPGGLDIDADGRVVLADRTGAKVVRVARDGQVETVVSGEPLKAPSDVAVLEGGVLAVTDAGAGKLFRVAADKTVTVAGDVPGAGSVAVRTGAAYLVTTAAGGAPGFPVEVNDKGASGTLPSGKGWLTKLEADNVQGGIAAGADGGVVWALGTHLGPNRANPSLGTYVVRLNPRGYATSLSYYGLGFSALGADVARVRWRDEPLPAEPGKTVQPFEPSPEVIDAPDAAVAPVETACRRESSGGCAAGSGGVGGPWGLVAVIVAGLMAVLAQRRSGAERRGRSRGQEQGTSLAQRRRGAEGRRGKGVGVGWLTVGLILGLAVASCGKSGRWVCPDGVTPPGPDVPVATDLGPDAAWVPEVVAPECKGMDLCEPGRTAVCVGTDSRKRCLPDDDGCWVWSAAVKCVGGTCADGVCAGPAACEPDCLGRECGDDGCGGSCGECAAPDSCCDAQCGPCVRDCDGRKCGYDGAGGSCGDCPADLVCTGVRCMTRGTGTCLDYLECADACPPIDADTCLADCDALLSPYGRRVVEGYVACTTVLCGECFVDAPPVDCLERCAGRHCSLQVAQCFNEKGTGNCKDGYACLDVCAEGDAACAQACVRTMSINAYMIAAAWETCLYGQCAYGQAGAEAEACEASAAAGPCKEAHEACFADCTPQCKPGVACGGDLCTGACGACPEGTHCVAETCESDQF